MTRGRLGLVGAGAVGPAVARILVRAGWEAGVFASPRLTAATAAAAFAGGGTPTTENAEAARDADLLILAVPDRAIAEVAAEIAAAGTVKRGALALHLSGALPSSILAPLGGAGASLGSLHPLQTFADASSAAKRLADTWLFFEGDDPERIESVARDLGGHPVHVDPEGKILYHAGAAAACNLAVAMVDAGVKLLEAAGIPERDALTALLPLVRGTVENLGKVGLPDALTGPVARGDTEVVRRHLEEIRAKAPTLLLPYAVASLHAVGIARAKGTLDDRAEAEIRQVIRRGLGETGD